MSENVRFFVELDDYLLTIWKLDGDTYYTLGGWSDGSTLWTKAVLKSEKLIPLEEIDNNKDKYYV